MYTLLSERHERETLRAYCQRGGYQSFTRAVQKTPEEIVARIAQAQLTGRGGANYPTAAKWDAVLHGPGPHYLIVNGAEGEPGSYKDRTVMEEVPHRLLEGLLIAAHAIQADEILIYVNDQFATAIESLRSALEELVASDIRTPPVPIDILPENHVYIAGEETALINALMGNPAKPWHKPPYPTERGFRDCPTAVNNVETLAWVSIALADPDEFQAKRPQLFSVTGAVALPGVYEVSRPVTLRELLEEAGGELPNNRWVAALPGGYSMPLVSASDFDVGLSLEALGELGTGLGASLIVVGEHPGVALVAQQILRFFAEESCGKCPVCSRATREFDSLWNQLLADQSVEAANELLRLADKHRKKGICSYLDTAARFAQNAEGWIRWQNA
ncbi:MAG: SLBB domain-containing protein [Firmicutes bacterium]|nr:SLBB domain-containing protein [Bacillota bacterium]